MLCDACGKEESIVHILCEIPMGSTKRELHLCSRCAAEFNMDPTTVDTLGLEELVRRCTELAEGLFCSPREAENPREAEESQLHCSACGLDTISFQESGLLGCAECYRAFAPILRRTLKTGQTDFCPRDKSVSVARNTEVAELVRLEHALNEAVAAEQYERAAELRDRIKLLNAATKVER